MQTRTFSLDVPAEKVVYIEKRRAVATQGGRDSVLLVDGDTTLSVDDTFVLVASVRTLKLTLPPIGPNTQKIAIHTAYANVTHAVFTTGNDCFISREGEGKKSCRLGVDNRHIFVGKNNMWYIC